MFHFLSGMDLFNQHTNKDAIKNILAVLMIVVVKADGKESEKERKNVLAFYKNEFNMDEEETITLFNSSSYDAAAYESALNEIQEIFKNDKVAKAKTLQHFNSVICCDGCVDVEYDVFEEIRKVLI